VALGLQHAHEHGLVHRDIKPGNLLRTVDGQIKIADFGLARLVSDGTVEGLTAENEIMGTADYVAPEQIRSAHTCGIGADLYSLGCTLYFLLAGRAPFAGMGVMEKLEAHAGKQPMRLSNCRPDLDPKLVRLVARLMAKKPEKRFRTAREAAEALASFADGGETLLAAQRSTLSLEISPSPSPGRSRGWRFARPRALVVAVGLLAVAFIAAFGLRGYVRHVRATPAQRESRTPRMAGPIPGGTAGSTEAQTNAIDLLALIEPRRDTLEGQWVRLDRTLFSNVSYPASLQIPYLPPEEYDLALVVEQVSEVTANQSLNIGLVVGGQQCHATINNATGSWKSDVGVVDGLDFQYREGHGDGPQLVSGHPVTLVCTVRRFGEDYLLRMESSGREIFSWKGSPARLSMFSYSQPVERGHLSLAAWNCAIRIHRLELVPRSDRDRGKPYSGRSLHCQPVRNRPGPEFPAGRWIELLGNVDLSQDVMRARWERAGAEIWTAGHAPAVLSLPVIPGASYQLQLDFTRVSGNEGLDIILPLDPTGTRWRCGLSLGMACGSCHALHCRSSLEGSSEGAVRKPGTLLTGHRYRALLSIETTGDEALVHATLDQETIIHWKGRITLLGVSPSLNFWLAHGPPTIGVVTHGDHVILHSARFRPISGQSSRLAKTELGRAVAEEKPVQHPEAGRKSVGVGSIFPPKTEPTLFSPRSYRSLRQTRKLTEGIDRGMSVANRSFSVLRHQTENGIFRPSSPADEHL
jgi:hypothetical protein